MKKIIIPFLLFFYVTSNAQVTTNGNFPVKGIPVVVTDWGSRSLYFVSNTFFTQTKDSIISQIGALEFDQMEAHCNLSGWPNGFYKADLSKEEDNAFDAELNKLKMYKIAAYTHIYNGKTFDRYAILRVPMNENRSWNPSVQWEGDIYFLLKEKDVMVGN